MDGLQLQRTRESALQFAEGLARLVDSRTDAAIITSFGQTSMQVRYESGSIACQFAAEAFIPGRGSIGARLGIAQVSFGQLRLPIEWCRPWISTNTVVPARITHPYRIFLDGHLGFIHVYDSRTNTVHVAMRSDSEIDGRTLVAPFRTSLHWLAMGTGAAVIHAAALAVSDTGVVIAGPSGSGKSTASLALARAGHGILGDDSVLLTATGAYALYRRAKVAPSSTVKTSWPPDAIEEVPLARAAKKVVRLDAAGVYLLGHTTVDLVLFPRIGRRLAIGHMPIREAVNLVAEDAAREVKESSCLDSLRIAESLRLAKCARVNIPAGIAAAARQFEEAIERSVGRVSVSQPK